jgi:hypothetical protein
MTLNNDDKLEVVNHCLLVNGEPFVVEYPDEPLSGIDEEGRLMTVFRGHLYNYWKPEEVKGYYA